MSLRKSKANLQTKSKKTTRPNKTLNLTVVLLCLLAVPVIAAAGWRSLAPGLDYLSVATSFADTPIHLVQVDLNRYRLGLNRAADRGQQRSSLHELIAASDAVLAINASFFDPDGKEMGLVVKDSEVLQPLRSVAWGVFQVNDDRAAIIHTRDYKKDASRSLAVQTGPRLVIAGKIPTFKDQMPAPRSAVCITPAQHVIFAATAAPITLTQMAQALKPYCRDALNLDGGSSTQFHVKALDLWITGASAVPNALTVMPR